MNDYKDRPIEQHRVGLSVVPCSYGLTVDDIGLYVEHLRSPALLQSAPEFVVEELNKIADGIRNCGACAKVYRAEMEIADIADGKMKRMIN